ncbi:MAG TPA: hypothetical protein VFP91_20895 [Vicinamibacterales bacterium]|nr:hypothetical protein [Vicinamibacterales bacterium]
MKKTLISLLVVVLAVVAASAVGPEAKYKAPRTESGQPDLQGAWNFTSGVPLQRPAKFADKKFFTKEEFDKQRAAIQNGLLAIARFAPVEAVGLDWIDNKLHVEDLRTSLITYPENGRLPAVVEGVRRMPSIQDIIVLVADGPSPELFSLAAMLSGGKRDSYEDFSVSERCLIEQQIPIVPQLGDNYVTIIQGRDTIALVNDEFRRVITLGGKAQVSSKVATSTGISTGHWEGDTLVVETKNFNNRTPSFSGVGDSRNKVVTERFTRTSKGTLEYAATVVDPTSFKDKIELSFPMARVDAHIFESTCHEGNYSMKNILAGVRKEEEEARKTK